MDDPDRPLRVADLFCGAGGLSQGFRDAGFEIALGLDRDKDSCATFALNHPGAVVLRTSITDVTPKEIADVAGPIDVLVGGPSCQGFSTAGRLGRRGRGSKADAPRWVRPGDVRNDLWRHMLEVVETLKPRAFLLENVPGLVYWKQGSLGETVLHAFETLGYAVDLKILLAADFGVPQRRRRLFVVGLLGKTKFDWPTESHMGGWRRDTLHLWEARRVAEGKLPHISCWEAIRDLPPLAGGLGLPETSYGGRQSTSPISTSLRRRSRALRDHEILPLGDAHQRLIELVPRGGTWRDIPPHLLPDRFRGMRRTDSTNLYGRLDPSLPAYTINTQFDNPSTGCYTHPFEDRPLSAREGARIQTFPDTYQFVGTLTSRCRQIGNAVPPLLAAVLADAIADQLLDGTRPAWRATIARVAPAKPPTDQTRVRMQRQRRADTGPEVSVRRELHARGLRFRKGVAVLHDRRSVDIVFPTERVAIFIDGCFWHGCPEHARPTKSNTLWWADKIAANKKRDKGTAADLKRAGWIVLRFWEHESPEQVAHVVIETLRALREPAA